ncbi:Alba DNA/RNA-binding protein [Perilla frutescens var. frutescens]|nr:Alba DNA/RNA-binding protein [Perilla frutescens var. frutescens]
MAKQSASSGICVEQKNVVRYLQQHKEIELSALGMAITTVVTIAEILKNNGFVNEKSIVTSTVGTKDVAKGRTVQKARIEIVLEKSEKFDSLMSASQNANANANGKVENKQ